MIPTLAQRSKQTLISSSISLVMVIFLAISIDWQDVLRVFRNGVSASFFWLFSIMALFIALIYGYRWRLLLERKLQYKASLVASILCLGGNMFLPARGGDLVRVHYSHLVAKMSHAEALSKLVLEKIIDLVVITIVGVLATVLLNTDDFPNYLFILTSSALATVIVVVVVITCFSEQTLRWLRPFFNVVGRAAFFERHIVRLVRELRFSLKLAILIQPGLITLGMWLTISAASYMLIARFVGVYLSYPESLVVLFAGALGLMLPAAPSGVGTFHASVVSSFILLGRTPEEGLLVGTAIHILYFMVYALPALIVYTQWRLGRKAPLNVIPPSSFSSN